MRLRSQRQLYIKPQSEETPVGEELEEVSKILDSADGVMRVYERALGEINCSSGSKGGRLAGREGMSAEQVIRAGILRRRFGYSYRELSHASNDSLSIREFLKLGFSKGFSKSALASNIKLISEGTWSEFLAVLTNYAIATGVENGDKLRADTTTTKTDIHYPTDSSLLNDSIRVLSRALTHAKEIGNAQVQFTNHYRASKKKLYLINNSRSAKVIRQHNIELIRLARNTLKFAKAGLALLESCDVTCMEELHAIMKATAELKHYIPLVERVIEQAHRRIVRDEKVPSDEKVLSLFEPHTNIIVKGKRDVVFGHKICLSTGSSAMVLDAQVLDGNPADSGLVKNLLENHHKTFGKAPNEAAFDGCFASSENRDYAKSLGVEELTFSKNRSLDINSLVSSRRVHKFLRNFRAGIEASISILKRVFGWTRILDKGLDSFKAGVQAGAVAYNLFILARIQLQT